MTKGAVQDLLGDFTISQPEGPKEVRPVTLWLPAADKARYDRLQEKSGRRFSKKAKEVLIELIGLAEERIT